MTRLTTSEAQLVEAPLAKLAVNQHGVAATSQLFKLGYPDQRIAVLACGPDSVLSHRCAAALHDVQRIPSGKIEVERAQGTLKRPGSAPAAGSRKSYCLLLREMETADVLKPDFASERKHFIFTDEHQQLRESIRRFVIKELQPHAEEWEETTFPDWVFERMGELGFLGLDKPEAYGGQGGDYYTSLVLAEEMAHAHSGGLAMGVAVQTDMAMPPILAFGSEEQKQAWAAPAIAGKAILAIGITEPDAGSDVAGIKTRAVRDEATDEYVINGSKTYITNGHRAHAIVLVTKTDQITTTPPTHDGFTLFLVPMDTPGVIREKRLKKLGMHASDTALLAFQRCAGPGHGGARPDRQGLLPHHVGAPGRAADRRRRRGRGRPAGVRQDAPVRQGAQGVRERDRPFPGDPP